MLHCQCECHWLLVGVFAHACSCVLVWCASCSVSGYVRAAALQIEGWMDLCCSRGRNQTRISHRNVLFDFDCVRLSVVHRFRHVAVWLSFGFARVLIL